MPRKRLARIAIVIAIQIPVAALHFVTGVDYAGPWPLFVNGYLLDILLPFSFYFLTTLRPWPTARPWLLRAGVVFLAASAAEVAQGFGIAVLGSTFDPLDFAAYGAGVLLAAAVDILVFGRFLRFWPKSEQERRIPDSA